jgi:hypothetical protein
VFTELPCSSECSSLSDAGAEALAAGLEKNTTLQTLDISQSHREFVGEEGFIVFYFLLVVVSFVHDEGGGACMVLIFCCHRCGMGGNSPGTKSRRCRSCSFGGCLGKDV